MDGRATLSPNERAGSHPIEGVGGPGARPGEADSLLWTATFQRALAIVNRKWVVAVVRVLDQGPRRQFQIRAEIRGIQLKVLRDTLKALERDGLVRQIVVRDGTATGLGWELTDTGRSLVQPLAAIYRWGRDHLGPAAASSDPLAATAG